MMNINICFMTNEAISTLRKNPKEVTQYIKDEKFDSKWIKKLCTGEIYEQKNKKIEDFELKTFLDGENYHKVALENAIILYEHLNKLPRYMLSDERFWAWINFEKCYKVTRQVMPMKSASTLGDHWLFNRGQRRGKFFGALSRYYFWTEETVNESLDDKYIYTRFVLENYSRIRNLSWRDDSNDKRVVFNIVKAEKDIYDKYVNNVVYKEAYNRCEKGENRKNIYTELAKALSLYGSVRILDIISNEDLYDFAYKKMENMIKEQYNGTLKIFDKQDDAAEIIDEDE